MFSRRGLLLRFELFAPGFVQIDAHGARKQPYYVMACECDPGMHTVLWRCAKSDVPDGNYVMTTRVDGRVVDVRLQRLGGQKSTSL